jgi:hypothetical protein
MRRRLVRVLLVAWLLSGVLGCGGTPAPEKANRDSITSRFPHNPKSAKSPKGK